MVTKKISELIATTDLTGNEVLPLNQSGVTKRSTIADILSAGGSSTPVRLMDGMVYGIGWSRQGACYDPVFNRTWVVCNGPQRRPQLTFFDHSTGQTGPLIDCGLYNAATGTQTPVSDSHGIPLVIVGNDGRAHVLWAAHNSIIRHWRATTPGGTVGTTTDLTGISSATYLSGGVGADGTLIVVFRAGFQNDHSNTATYPSHPYAGLIRSTNGGTSWTEFGAIIDSRQVTASPAHDAYLVHAHMAPGTNRLHLLWFISNGIAHDDTRSNVYHAVWDNDTSKMYNQAGLDLGVKVFGTEHPDCLVHNNLGDGSEDDDRCVTTGIDATDDSMPVVTYINRPGGAADGDVWERKVAVWTGAAWVKSTISTTGSVKNFFTMPPLRINATTIDVWLRGPVDVNGRSDTQRWRTINNGTSWALVETLWYGSRGPASTFSNFVVPDRATPALTLIAQPIGVDAINSHYPVVGFTRGLNHLQKWQPAPIVETITSEVNSIFISTGFTTEWTKVSLTTSLFLPPNTTEIIASVSLFVTGPVAVNYLSFRKPNAPGDQVAGQIGIANGGDDVVSIIMRLPVINGQIEYKLYSTANVDAIGITVHGRVLPVG